MVIGYASVGGGHEHAFAYANNNLRDLGTLGGNYSYAIDVNDRNVVVGGSFTDAADTVYHAFVSVGETMVDLNGQLDASGAGWVLIEARAINDAGQIVGTGRRNGSYRAFLLNPKTAPPPTITRINRQGADVVIEFSTVAGAVYRLEDRSGVGGGGWAALGDAMSGIDGQTVVTNLGGGGQTMRFYRVSVAPQ
jgi:probable HAF family extracellular repeat protein